MEENKMEENKMEENKEQDTKRETRKYYPKVDISHYFGYGGHDIIASKIVLNYIIKQFYTTKTFITTTINNTSAITHDDIMKGFKNHSEFNIRDFNFKDE